MMDKKKVFIILPGLNEEKHIGQLISNIKKQGYSNIIFVDDGSNDKSSEVAKSSDAIVIRHIINMGKGAATKTGCGYAIKKGAKILVLMDSDGQHKPEDLNRIVSELVKNKRDIVIGRRKIDKNMPFMMTFGNWFIDKASGLINGIDLQDTQSGLRCFTSETYKKIKWKSDDYSMESEMIANIAKNRLKYSQIFIETIYLDNFKGTTIFDGIKIFLNIIKFRIFR